MTLPSAFFGSEHELLQQWSGGRFDFEASKAFGAHKNLQPFHLHPPPHPRQRKSSKMWKVLQSFASPAIESEKREARGDVKRTVYTWWCRSRRSRHLSREAGAFDGLGSLFDFVLVAASVCGDYLTCSCFHVNWKHKKSGRSSIKCFNIFRKKYWGKFYQTYFYFILPDTQTHRHFWISWSLLFVVATYYDQQWWLIYWLWLRTDLCLWNSWYCIELNAFFPYCNRFF